MSVLSHKEPWFVIGGEVPYRRISASGTATEHPGTCPRNFTKSKEGTTEAKRSQRGVVRFQVEVSQEVFDEGQTGNAPFQSCPYVT